MFIPFLFGLDDAAAGYLLANLAVAAGSIISNISTNKANKNLYQQQNQFNEQMQDKQNEYNLPENQVTRLQDAGINPIAGTMSNGITVGGNTSAPINQSTAFPFVDLMSGLSNNTLSMMNSYKLFAEGKTENSMREYRIKETQARTSDYLANVAKLGVDTRGQQIANDYAQAFNELALKQDQLNLDLTYEQVNSLKKGIEKMIFELEKVLPQEVKESESRTNLNVLEQDHVLAVIERTYAETENIEANTENVEAQTDTEGIKQSALVQGIQESESTTRRLDQEIQLFLDTYDDQVNRIASEAKLSKREAQMYIIKSSLDMIQSGAFTFAGASAGVKALKGLGSGSRIGF